MIFEKYKEKYPENVLVTIEKFNRLKGFVLVDFLDSNEFRLFAETFGLSNDLNRPSMILLKNYTLKTVRENTIYAIDKEVLLSGLASDILKSNYENSYVIGYVVDLKDFSDEIFSESISLTDNTSYRDWETDRKSTRLNSSHITRSRMPSSA